MSFKGRDIVSIRDFNRDEVEHVLNVARLMEPLTMGGSKMLDGKVLSNIFFEPSTRTRLSFESAILKLGGNYISIPESQVSSVVKGENLVDTIRVLENYADVIVLRHFLEGAARLASEVAVVPVINAGSGGGEHPTQAMLDLYTMERELGTIDGLSVALVGDLKYGRTVHSLAYALSLYDTTLYLVSPKTLEMRREIVNDVSNEVTVVETNEVGDVIPNVDVLYVTRIQKERFPDQEEYEKIKGVYRISSNTLQNAKSNLIVLHPLPRVDEVTSDVDYTPHARYFKETWYGLVTRMALLCLVLGAIE
ncbi:MAG: aspartate carbamoyltransferase [Candidatus Bathyarchaeota archaeon]|nr:aspartate carbamoyltransferase [Candidatus Bathyarchaeota archaeon]